MVTPAAKWKAAERARHRKDGRVAVTHYVYPEDREKVARYIKRLNQRRVLAVARNAPPPSTHRNEPESRMYEVTLSHAKNPDIRGGYWNEGPREGRARVAAATVQDAAKLCRAYIERNSLGGGNWTGGKVYEGKRQIARVSYNGRVWAMDGSEFKADDKRAEASMGELQP